jgi:hypothetical protein
MSALRETPAMRTPESEMSPTRSCPPAAETSSIRALRRT